MRNFHDFYCPSSTTWERCSHRLILPSLAWGEKINLLRKGRGKIKRFFEVNFKSLLKIVKTKDKWL